jgi:hypothetical protein
MQQPAQQVFVESYKGKYEDAQRQFREAAARYAQAGFQPTSQNWVRNGASGGCLFVALVIILFITIIGILLLPFIFMGRNKGTLTVTYAPFSSTPPPVPPPGA